MNEIILTPKEQPSVPLELLNVNPDTVAGKSIDEIRQIKIAHGNTEVELSEFFNVKGESSENPSEIRIVIDGDVYNTKRIGYGMQSGEILVKGNASMYVGTEMKGGKIVVEGNVGSWAGRDMEGGELIIMGNAGDYVGSAYRGDWRGMSGGKITVHGNAGNEIGEYMLGGKIEVKGNATTLAGIHMNGGVLVIHGDATTRVGGEMMNGTIIVKGRIDEFLPGFKYHGIEKNIEIDGEVIDSSFYKFEGDFAVKGCGGIVYANASKNGHIVP
ncbi:MAG: formylmethanofuran dehydrogenase subunit C [Methanobacterium sp.]|nr:formylmethanofuran dehydrogenase subunit C [Euryarchaeota archaeon]MBV1730426.1 formylmethanofuran dehydrogenase subunit C [Methanobacterium sp.]MBV1755759.1 formylmethanofuran dehydrogenase subunit C [Methanobacterium sp.]